MWVAAWLLCYQAFYKLDIVSGRKIDSDDQRVEDAINHVTETKNLIPQKWERIYLPNMTVRGN